MRPFASARQRGFSMIEMIVAIVIMSIIAIGLVQFIVDSSTGYAVSASRNQVSSAGRIVIDRIAMDLHNALPESVRISPENPPDTDTVNSYAGDQCLEFIPVVAATTYINPTFRPAAANSSVFEVVNFVPVPAAPLTGYYASIYPTSSADLYKDSFSNTEAIVAVTFAVGNPTDGKHELDPVGSHRFKRRSSVERLFLSRQPVSYCITGSKLYRYSDYGFHTTQLVPEIPAGGCVAMDCLPAATTTMAGGHRVLITDQLDNSALIGDADGQAFDQLAASRTRNGVIQLDLNFRQDGQEVRLNHEIMQQSTP